ncbi:MAG: dihydropteroate synthase [Treponema sp.]|uniref:dihydropteroate synthase n=2 Tax=Treponema sp. TaxID=166 RepID=UPI00298DC0E4|nr:dihydropteroate synthase [Treponema sp.]MCR5386317.1 dihydropteroate synthase [Treponema sp.]
MLEFNLKSKTISTQKNSFIVGIVNANRNSFWEKSRGGFSLAEKLIEDGADILDIGAESTRPGASYIEEKDELAALVPLVRKIRKYYDIPISIDTRKKNVIKACVEEGADILNDISALEDDENMASYAAQAKIPVILMHKRGNSVIMDKNTEYENVFKEVHDYLISRAEYAVSCGIDEKKIILDPGIGFAKDFNGNRELIKNIKNLCSEKFPVMMALSRKRVIGEMTGRDVKDRLAGTLTANIFSVLNGVKFLRVHDVKETADALNVLKELMDVGN